MITAARLRVLTGRRVRVEVKDFRLPRHVEGTVLGTAVAVVQGRTRPVAADVVVIDPSSGNDDTDADLVMVPVRSLGLVMVR